MYITYVCYEVFLQCVCIISAPCVPQSVSSFLDCMSNSLNVSWALGGTALNYSVLAKPASGAVLSCTTRTSSCIITGLQCGQSYTTVVTAANGECRGPESVTRSFQTGANLKAITKMIHLLNLLVKNSWIDS